jgi:acid phosphatase (class A)
LKNEGDYFSLHYLLVILACVAITSGCAGFEAIGGAAAISGMGHDLVKGYLPQEALPNSLILIPAPPAIDSAEFALDEEVARRNVALRGTARWMLAIADADLSFPNAAGTFSCAVGAPITEEDTPHLYMLLRKTLTDAGHSTHAAKVNYSRARPFTRNQEPICTPEKRAFLEMDGSYPSGHTAVGWAWALILAEVAPEHADRILARGLTFGESRNVCNVHWHSDVVQGRLMGAASVARLHAEPTFRADLEAARAELAAVRAKDLQPVRDCKAEAAALAR